MYKKILVPLDGSELAEVALPYAEEIALKINSEVNLLQVVPQFYGLYKADGEIYEQVPYIEEKMGILSIKAKDYLDKVAMRLLDKGINAVTAVRTGLAVNEVGGLAKETNTDIIIMSTHGRTGIGRWAMGSVANKIVRSSERPVILIRAKDAHPEVRQKDILDKILVPLDGSKESEAVIPYIERLAIEFNIEVTLLHMLAPDPYIYSAKQFDLMESHKIYAKNYIESIASKLEQKGIVAKAMFREVTMGYEADEIIKLADKIQADLVAMSTHGQSGVNRWILGGIADRVLHGGNTPLLLLRPS
jgi:nucleotide-binding universal stress UspA family protein